jgi:hypothetical protein
MTFLVKAMHCTPVIISYNGDIKANLICLSAARGSVEDAALTSDDSVESSKQPLAASARSSKAKKRRIKSSLLSSKVLWSLTRTTAPGQVRQEGMTIMYQLSRVVFIIKLYTNSVCIETVKQNDGETSFRSYPISATLKNIDSKSYINTLCEFGEWGHLTGSDLFKRGTTDPLEFPFTISIITLPFRLLSLSIDVIRRMLRDLNLLIEVKGNSARFEPVTITLARVSMVSVNGNKTFSIGDITLSKSITKELRPILNSLSCSNRPKAKVLDSIKAYLRILKSALTLLDRGAAIIEQE